jgi:hypothetical protein
MNLACTALLLGILGVLAASGGYDRKLARGVAALQRQATAHPEARPNGRQASVAPAQLAVDGLRPEAPPAALQELAAHQARMASIAATQVVGMNRKITVGSIYSKPVAQPSQAKRQLKKSIYKK